VWLILEHYYRRRLTSGTWVDRHGQSPMTATVTIFCPGLSCPRDECSQRSQRKHLPIRVPVVSSPLSAPTMLTSPPSLHRRPWEIQLVIVVPTCVTSYLFFDKPLQQCWRSHGDHTGVVTFLLKFRSALSWRLLDPISQDYFPTQSVLEQKPSKGILAILHPTGPLQAAQFVVQ
jgi:hypothetical protein